MRRALSTVAATIALLSCGCVEGNSAALPSSPSSAAAVAIAAAPAPLFSEDARSPGAPPQPPVVRSRQALADVAAVGFGSPTLAARLTLNLFADTRYVAVFDHALNSPLSDVWYGTLEGVADSEVVLAVSGGVFAATVTLPTAYYSVMPGDGGRVLIAQIDRNALAPPD